MRVICRTNLDLLNERWPTELPAVPHVGDMIQSGTEHNGFKLSLQVVSVTWKKEIDIYGLPWVPEIELHMGDAVRYHKYNDEGKYVSFSIADFYRWYAPKVGKSVSYFI